MSPALRVWCVQAGGPRSVAAILAELGDPAAVDEGRVWVDRQRVLDSAQVLAVGSRVEVHAARTGSDQAAVVAERDGLVVAYKPAALPSEPDRTGHASLVTEVAEVLGVARVHAVSRLDVGVSGLVLVSVGQAAHQRAAALREAGGIARRYVAIAERAPSDAALTAPVDGRNARTRVEIVAQVGPHRHPSGSEVSPVLLALCPVTGRKHQLRVHAGPLLGDRAHGGVRRLTRADGAVVELPRIMLHAARLEVALPGGEPWIVTAPVAEDLVRVWCALDGDAVDVDRAAG
ncbi:MAG: RluA family pseudouridine synthase [Myxococcales bacterium]|nr:RluA family pseudouridine synthase [Myxococcales bacterium]